MSVLLKPIQIGPMKLSNRFVRSATHDGFSSEKGEITDKTIAFISDLAIAGTGLIIMGFAYVNKNGQALPNQTAIYDDCFIPGLKRVVEAVHRYDSKVVLQIGNSGSQSVAAQRFGYTPLTPSAVKKEWVRFDSEMTETRTDQGTPEFKVNTAAMEAKEMTEEEIHEFIQGHAQAARRVREAGFDGVQFHGGHGYLISQFASPVTNRRADKWGGPLENRLRFILSCYKEVRTAVGDDYPVMIKLGMEDQARGGLPLAEGIQMAKILAQAGINAIEISEGVEEEPAHHIRAGVNSREKEAYYLNSARAVRKEVDIPLFLVGGLRSFDIMEKVVAEDIADCVSLCRPFIREPDLVEKYRKGESGMVTCISCNGCLKKLQGGLLACIFND